MPRTSIWPLWIIVLGSILFSAPPAGAASEQPVPVPVKGQFTDDDGKVSTNLSGIACQPDAAGKRVCLAIDDQGRFAQIAFLEAGTLIAGKRIELIGKKPSPATVGSPPTKTKCPENEARFKDLDGEGVAYAAPFFYVIGSHGCSRKSGKFNTSSFITVRLRLNSEGRLLDRNGAPVADTVDPASIVETTYRLADALLAADPLKSGFGTELQGSGSDGVNIEGVAVIDGRLLAGVRAPSIGGNAFLVGIKVEDLFAPGTTGLAATPTVATLPLGQDTGIRDLAPLPDGRLLVLSGPTRDAPNTHYRVFLARPPFEGAVPVKLLAELEDVQTVDEKGKPVRAKAEAILPLDAAADAPRAIILFDGLPNGGAAKYKLERFDN